MPEEIDLDEVALADVPPTPFSKAEFGSEDDDTLPVEDPIAEEEEDDEDLFGDEPVEGTM